MQKKKKKKNKKKKKKKKKKLHKEHLKCEILLNHSKKKK